SPPFKGGAAAPLIKRPHSLAAQTGWSVISNKIRSASRISIRGLRDLLLTTPSAPLRMLRSIYLIAQPPLLEHGEWGRNHPSSSFRGRHSDSRRGQLWLRETPFTVQDLVVRSI